MEYAAAEKFYELHSSGRFDLIIIDTPPSQHAIDFLEAPGKLLDFIEMDALKWLFRAYGGAGRMSMKLLDISTRVIFGTLGRMAGADTLRELAEFIIAMATVFEAFAERYREVRALWKSNKTGFVLVTSTHFDQRQARLQFLGQLHAADFDLKAMVVNRLRPMLATDPAAPEIVQAVQHAITEAAHHQGQICDKAALQSVATALQEEAMLGQRDHERLEQILGDTEGEGGNHPVFTLPELPQDVSDIEGLVTLQAQAAPV